MNGILRLVQRLLEGAGDRSTLRGPGYVARVPPGFVVQPIHAMGGYLLLPPGSTPPPVSPAIVLVEPVLPMMLPALLQHLHGMENPFLSQMNAASLGLQSVTKLAPARQQAAPGGTAHIRELDGVSASGQPLRMILVLIVGTMGIAKVIIAVKLYRWKEFIGPCLEFLGSINASGRTPCPSNVFAVIDPKHKDQVQISGGSDLASATPWTAMPVRVGNQPLLVIEKLVLDLSTHTDKSISIRDIIGATAAIGEHSTVKVS